MRKGTPGLKNFGDLLKLIFRGELVKYILLSIAFSSVPVACSVTFASINSRLPSGNQSIFGWALIRSVETVTIASPPRNYKGKTIDGV